MWFLGNRSFEIINKHFTIFAIGIAKTNGYSNESNLSTRYWSAKNALGTIVVYDIMAWFDRVSQLKRSRGGKIMESGDKILFDWVSLPSKTKEGTTREDL